MTSISKTISKPQMSVPIFINAYLDIEDRGVKTQTDRSRLLQNLNEVFDI